MPAQFHVSRKFRNGQDHSCASLWKNTARDRSTQLSCIRRNYRTASSPAGRCESRQAYKCCDKLIDEAHSLDPKKNSEGQCIVTKILNSLKMIETRLQSSWRAIRMTLKLNFTLRIRDFKADSKVFSSNCTEDELESLLVKIIRGRDWSIDPRHSELTGIAARRLARRRGTKGFARY
jgi:hypothetical protein